MQYWVRPAGAGQGGRAGLGKRLTNAGMFPLRSRVRTTQVVRRSATRSIAALTTAASAAHRVTVMSNDTLLIDRSGFRRWAGAMSLIASGPLILAGLLATPYPDNAATTVREPFRTQLAADLLFLGYLLLVPAAFAMLRLVKRRGAILAHLGLILAVFGLVALPGLLSTDFYELGIAQLVGPAQADAVSNHLSTLPGAFLILLPSKFAGPVGLALIAVATWRSGSVRWWTAVATALGIVAMAILARGVPAIEAAGAIVLTAGLVGIAVSVLRDVPATASEAGPAAERPASRISPRRA